MYKKEKVEKLLEGMKTQEFYKRVTKTKESFLEEFGYIPERRSFKFELEGEPINYVRERSGRGNHFYNPKGDLMREKRLQMIKSYNKDDYNYTRDLIKNPDNEYYIYLDVQYFLAMPKSTSNKKAAMMEMGMIKPDKTPDLDNLDKFIIDALHDVVYDDDKRVMEIHTDKYYSMTPRTIVNVTIEEHKKDILE